MVDCTTGSSAEAQRDALKLARLHHSDSQTSVRACELDGIRREGVDPSDGRGLSLDLLNRRSLSDAIEATSHRVERGDRLGRSTACSCVSIR